MQEVDPIASNPDEELWSGGTTCYYQMGIMKQRNPPLLQTKDIRDLHFKAGELSFSKLCTGFLDLYGVLHWLLGCFTGNCSHQTEGTGQLQW